MTYAVDSNVILDILYDDPLHAQSSIAALTKASGDGALVACDVVWAETSARFADKAMFRRTMADFGISFSAMTESASVRAGGLWNASRREKKRKGIPSRTEIIPDFLVGAHAFECADALITRDRGFLRKWFSDLAIIDPSAQTAALT